MKTTAGERKQRKRENREARAIEKLLNVPAGWLKVIKNSRI